LIAFEKLMKSNSQEAKYVKIERVATNEMTIKVKTLTGKILSIKIKGDNTIEDLKLIVQY